VIRTGQANGHGKLNELPRCNIVRQEATGEVVVGPASVNRREMNAYFNRADSSFCLRSQDAEPMFVTRISMSCAGAVTSAGISETSSILASNPEYCLLSNTAALLLKKNTCSASGRVDANALT
jgi:hypothetical protein